MDTDIKNIIEAAHAGGKVVRQYFGQVLQIEEKSHVSDFRTSADTESEKVILDIIKARFPTYSIYSEEAGEIDKQSEYKFVVDPLDGSNNFVLGIPDFTVSIALMKGDDTIAGVVYNPILNKTYHALAEQGAFIDDSKIQVNQESDITRATICYTCGYINSSDYSEQISHRLNELKIKRQINFWSPAYDYCLLASGKIEGIINNKNDLYDYAAGRIIVREAGGKITDFSGKADNDKNDTFVASNGTAVHRQLMEIL